MEKKNTPSERLNLLLQNLKDLEVSSKTISDKTGLSNATVEKFVSGQSKKPHASTIEKIELAMPLFKRMRDETTNDGSLFLNNPAGPQTSNESAFQEQDSKIIIEDEKEVPSVDPRQGTGPRLHVEDSQSGSSHRATTKVSSTIRSSLHVPDQEIFIPVHGFVWLTKAELQIVDHSHFQRLRRVKQLGLAYEVYPGASHSRYEHVLGVVHVTGKVISAIAENHKRAKDKNQLSDASDTSHWSDPLNDIETAFCRLAALLHDIGHLPFGHSLEDELGLLNHHDKEDRLFLIFKDLEPPRSYEENELVTRKLGEVIDDSYAANIFDSDLRLDSVDRLITPTELVTSIILHEPTSSIKESYRKVLLKGADGRENTFVGSEEVREAFAKDLAKLGIRLNVCADIVGNTICADLLDYLHRDWHHVGKSRFLDDRVFHYMEIRKDPKPEDTRSVQEIQSSDRFVLNLGRYPRLRTDAISIILELLESRYNLAEAVLFHRTKLKLTAMLERCLTMTFDRKASITGPNRDTKLEINLLQISEDGFMDELCKEAPEFKTTQTDPESIRQRQRLAVCIRDRSLFKHVLTISMLEGRTEVLMRCQEIYTNPKTGPLNREKALLQAEADFGLKRGELVMYCPNKKMNSKIAEVKVLIGGELHQLDTFDRDGVQKLASGHLAAQIERFKKLWLVTFLIDPAVERRLDLSPEEFSTWRNLLADYLQAFVVGTSQMKTIDQARSETVARMAVSKEFLKVHKFNKLNVEMAPITTAARTGKTPMSDIGMKGGCSGIFPTNAFSFWQYVQQGEKVR